MESLDRRGVGHRCLEVEPGSIRILLSSAVNAYYLRERFLPFGRTRRSEESRALVPQKRLGCIAYFFRLHSARTRILYSPCKLTNQDTRSYEPPSAVSMHPSLKAKLTRSDNATDSARRTKEALHRQDSGSAEPSSCRQPTCENREAKSQDQGCPPKRVGIGDCTTKSASHGEPAGDRVRLSEE